MNPKLGMRLLSGPKGLECTNCSWDPRYKDVYDFVVEVAVVRCGMAVHEVRLCARCARRTYLADIIRPDSTDGDNRNFNSFRD